MIICECRVWIGRNLYCRTCREYKPTVIARCICGAKVLDTDEDAQQMEDRRWLCGKCVRALFEHRAEP